MDERERLVTILAYVFVLGAMAYFALHVLLWPPH
jgi:hypothetical protein